MNTLAVLYKQDQGTDWWTAVVPAEPGVVTQGKTLKEAHTGIRQALALVRDDADSVHLKGESDWSSRHDLPDEILQLVKDETDLRIMHLDIQSELDRKIFEAVERLIIDKGYSFRSVGNLLGVTHQRVEQIAKTIRGAG